MAKRKATLNDVAHEAGVSASTVSRYMKGQLNLRPDTERKIIDAISSEGYVRPSSRSDSAQGESPGGTIGVVVPEVGNDYFSRIADRVVAAAESNGYSVLVASTSNNSRRQLDYVRLLTSLGVDGLVYLGNYASNAALAAEVAADFPVVVVDEQLSGIPSVDTVLVDDYAGAYQAVAYLGSLGHERIAFVGGPAWLHSVQERMRGWRDALRRSGADADDQLILNGTFSEEFGAASLSHILATAKNPTAVFAASDTIALGLMAAARRLGMSVPKDLSIVGFDDVPAASLVTPRLTTIHTPVGQMASTAVTMLIERLDGSRRAAASRVTSVSLVVGESAVAPQSAT